VEVGFGRVNGQSFRKIITAVNRTTHGWFEYFKHTSHSSVFRGLDGWIRRRLRRMLWKRLKRSRSGLGASHQRWPNAYFAKLGLFSTGSSPRLGSSIRGTVKHRPESRMRENRLYGSEGGEIGKPIFPTPITRLAGSFGRNGTLVQ